VTVLVTGAGLVGTQVAALEQAAGRCPVLFDIQPQLDALNELGVLEKCDVVAGDVTDPFALVAAVRKYGVRRIVHTAAYPGFTISGRTAPLSTVRVNVLGTAHVLETARLFELDRVVLCSSAAQYIDLEGGEDAGAFGREHSYPRPATVYATTKQAAEDLGRNYAAAFGVQVVAVRFNGVFGPGRSGGSGMAGAAMASWITAALAGRPVEVTWPRLEWVYSKDAARGAFLACWADGLKGSVYNVGMGVAVSAGDIADAIRAAVPGADITVDQGADVSAVLSGDKAAMDPRRAAAELGYEPAFDLSRAVADYSDWLRAHPG